MDTPNMIKEGDKITKEGWRKGRFATLISINEKGDFCARFGTRGKYFYSFAKYYKKVV